jgi:PAS domain S-box-containing protein
MSRSSLHLSGTERHFEPHEVIVSKTDLKGRITYANSVFKRISGYTEAELMGAPHSILRHPHMPRCVFKLLWDTIEAGKEIFAYVINRNKAGDHYWVFAHVTPSFDKSGAIIGYHSNRRVPRPEAVQQVIPLYKALLDIEESHQDRKAGMAASLDTVVSLLRDKGIGYDEFVFTL